MSLLETARLGDDERLAYRQRGFVVPRWRLPAQRVRGDGGGARPAHRGEPARPPRASRAALGRRSTDALPTHARFLAWALVPRSSTSSRSSAPTSSCGARTCSANRRAPASRCRGTRTAPTGRSARSPRARCGSRSTLEHRDGCLRVVPGSHRARTEFHHRTDERPISRSIASSTEGQFDEASAEDVVLKAGQMSLHDVFMIHGSRANRSPRRRAGFAIRYMPATSLYDRTLRAARRLGRDPPEHGDAADLPGARRRSPRRQRLRGRPRQALRGRRAGLTGAGRPQRWKYELRRRKRHDQESTRRRLGDRGARGAVARAGEDLQPAAPERLSEHARACSARRPSNSPSASS